MTNYRRGVAFEYQVRDHFLAAGFVVIRSAGSHGVVDLCAHRPGAHYGIQCKRDGRLSTADRAALEAWGRASGLIPVLAVGTTGQRFLWQWLGTPGAWGSLAVRPEDGCGG